MALSADHTLQCFHPSQFDMIMEDKPANTPILIWSDATTAGSEWFVVGVRLVFDDPSSDKIHPVQRILALTSTKGHDNALTAAGTVYRVLCKYEQEPDSVYGHARDTTSMNGCMDNTLRGLGGFNNLFSLPCVPHGGSNAGGKLLQLGCHPVLIFFWAPYQNVLRSNAACDLFCEVNGEAVEQYSSIKWFSQYDAIEQFRCVLNKGTALLWITRVMEHGYAKESAFKIFELLSNASLMHYLKIELASYSQGGAPMRLMTSKLEGDGEVAFVAYDVISDTMASLRPLVEGDGSSFPVPKVSALASAAVVWTASTEAAEELKIAEEDLAVAQAAVEAGPPPAPVVQRVSRRQFNGTAAETKARVTALAAAKKQADEEKREREKELKEEALVAKLAAMPPRTVGEWEQYARSHLHSAAKYLIDRFEDINDYGGAIMLFQGISVFHPRTLSMLDLLDARKRLQLLRKHHHFDNDEVMQGLLEELVLAKAEADEWGSRDHTHRPNAKVAVRRDLDRLKVTVGKVKSFDKITDKYTVVFGTGKDKDEQVVPSAQVQPEEVFSVLYYLKQRKGKLPAWFKASKILVLLQPSSAAAERVFSLLEAFFSKKGSRGRALDDLVNATLKLMYHDRDV